MITGVMCMEGCDSCQVFNLGLRKQLVQTGALPVEPGDAPKDEDSNRGRKSIYSSNATAALSSDEDDDDYDDGGYTKI